MKPSVYDKRAKSCTKYLSKNKFNSLQSSRIAIKSIELILKKLVKYHSRLKTTKVT